MRPIIGPEIGRPRSRRSCRSRESEESNFKWDSFRTTPRRWPPANTFCGLWERSRPTEAKWGNERRRPREPIECFELYVSTPKELCLIATLGYGVENGFYPNGVATFVDRHWRNPFGVDHVIVTRTYVTQLLRSKRKMPTPVVALFLSRLGMRPWADEME